MKRLWLTDDQAYLVVAALRSYNKELQSKFDDSINRLDEEAAENINNVMNKLDGILDILTED